MRIIGLDISKSSASACLLSELPSNIRRLWHQIKTNSEQFPILQASNAGVNTLLDLKPDILVLEPTGGHYSRLWSLMAEKENIPVLWVGHMEIVHFRKSYKLPNKNDRADAFALSCYAHLHAGEDEFFLDFAPYPITRIREIALQLETIHRLVNPYINRVRQQLSHQFPEAAFIRSESCDGRAAPLWTWLAQRTYESKRKSSYYDRLYEQSVARRYGICISDFTRKLASHICDLQEWEHQLLDELKELVLLSPEFQPYNQTFHNFGMGIVLRAWLLANIYPLERFLVPDSVPHYSSKSFKLRIGMGLVESSSGDVTRWVPGGSKYCRKHLWLWVLTRIAPKNKVKVRPQSAIAQRLCDYYDELKAGELRSQKMAHLRISRTCAKASNMLFDELVKAVAG